MQHFHVVCLFAIMASIKTLHGINSVSNPVQEIVFSKICWEDVMAQQPIWMYTRIRAKSMCGIVCMETSNCQAFAFDEDISICEIFPTILNAIAQCSIHDEWDYGEITV
jgi:hypothetical protein